MLEIIQMQLLSICLLCEPTAPRMTAAAPLTAASLTKGPASAASFHKEIGGISGFGFDCR